MKGFEDGIAQVEMVLPLCHIIESVAEDLRRSIETGAIKKHQLVFRGVNGF